MPDKAVRRRSGAPSKGDLRELKILEVLEIDAITAILVRAGVPDRAGPPAQGRCGGGVLDDRADVLPRVGGFSRGA
jgi:hypothetical protein